MRVRSCCLAAFKDDAMAKLGLRLGLDGGLSCHVVSDERVLGHGGDAKQRLVWMVG